MSKAAKESLENVRKAVEQREASEQETSYRRLCEEREDVQRQIAADDSGTGTTLCAQGRQQLVTRMATLDAQVASSRKDVERHETQCRVKLEAEYKRLLEERERIDQKQRKAYKSHGGVAGYYRFVSRLGGEDSIKRNAIKIDRELQAVVAELMALGAPIKGNCDSMRMRDAAKFEKERAIDACEDA